MSNLHWASTWYKQHQTKVEEIITLACRRYWIDNRDRPNFAYDLFKSTHEQAALSSGGDLCYDRFTVPLAYTLWYQPRRINTVTHQLLALLSEILSQREYIHIYDIGAGTGAVQCASVLVLLAMRNEGKSLPMVKLSNVDSSPIMLEFHRQYIWPALCDIFPDAANLIDFQFNCESWTSSVAEPGASNVIFSSYLIDATDSTDVIEKNFCKILQSQNPEALVQLSSSAKSNVLNKSINAIEKQGYIKLSDANKLFFQGDCRKLGALRQEISNHHGLQGGLFKTQPQWDEHFYELHAYARKEIDMILEEPPVLEKPGLFTPSIEFIKEVPLSSEQLAACRLSERPEVIKGPAGSGKTVVLTRKIEKIVTESGYDPELRILATTFNKGLTKYISNWLIQLLDNNRFQYRNEKGMHQFSFNQFVSTSITILHFDILPQRLCSVAWKGKLALEKNKQILKAIIEKKIEIFESLPADVDLWLTPEFIEEEYHRIIFDQGFEAHEIVDQYLVCERAGRGIKPRLPRNSAIRQLIAEVCVEYLQQLKNQKLVHFIDNRQMALKNLEAGRGSSKAFDYVLVDEFQDCTQTEFRIFSRLLKNPNNLSVAGDLAQALHLGKSSRMPREGLSKNWKKHILTASYRLPQRISEALAPIASEINTVREDNESSSMRGYKGSPPGARPIVIVGKNTTDAAVRLSEALCAYQSYQFKTVTIFEYDSALANCMRQQYTAGPIETHSILALKGMERRCVVWSTRSKLHNEKEQLEFAYTILTRTNRCLFIVLFEEDTTNEIGAILKLLNSKRLIFWDQNSEDVFRCITDQAASG